jgi:Leucine-rich repeat (LRR) protein
MSKKKLAGIILGCIVVVIVVVVAVRLSTVCYLRPLSVNFADHNLEAAVREAIAKPEGTIYPSDLADLTSLDASDRNITNLSGLENCIDLTELWLNDNKISDITPLSHLTNLELLSLNGNQVDNISALSHLTNVNYLYLADNEISDITSLSNLVNLGKHTFFSIPPSEDLDLSNNQINDISPLSRLTGLEWVVLDDNNISDITPLSNLTNLTKLSLSDNQIRDISPLANLTNLVMLHLTNNQIDDITPLSNLVVLGTQEWEMIPLSLHLDLGGNQITDITPLSNLTTLKRLSLSNNQISGVSPLANLTDLTTVYLWENPLSSDSTNIYVPELRARGVDVSLTSQNQQPIEIVSVLGPVGPVNWGGPAVEITLKNVGVEPVISLTATLEAFSAFGTSFDLTFNVTPSNPLQPNKSTSDTLCLIGGGFIGGNVSYPLKIHATLQNGAKFVYTKMVQIVEPS